VLHQVDRRGSPRTGRTSTAAWLQAAHHAPGHRHPAGPHRQALHDDPAGPLVRTRRQGDPAPARPADAFAAGQLSTEHVAVITTAVTDLPDTLDTSTRADAETALVKAAAAHDPRALAHIGTHLRHTLDDTGGADLADTEDHQVTTRELQLREQNDGSWSSAATSTPSSAPPSAPAHAWPDPPGCRPRTEPCAPRPTQRRRLAELRRYAAADLSTPTTAPPPYNHRDLDA
jgi:hypothetical protein